MKHIKKLLLTITALAIVLSLSGCYWEGKTKLHSEQLLLDELEEKYNEEFIIQQIGVSSARSGGPLVAYCSPKDDEELVFETELYQFGDNISLRDMYIQSIVRREMKEQIDSVLSKYYDNFASEVYVRGLTSTYDSGIKDAKQASITTFTEAIPEDNDSSIWIVIDNKEVIDSYDINHFKKILSEVVDIFHKTTAAIHVFIVTDAIVTICNSEICNNLKIMDITAVLSDGKCISDSNNYIATHKFRYVGNDIGLDYVNTIDANGSLIINN